MKTFRLATVGLALMAVTFVLPARGRAESYQYQTKNLSEYASCYEYDPDMLTGYSLYAYASDYRQHVAGGGADDYTYGYVYYSTYDDTTGKYCYGYGQVTDQSISSKLTLASMSAMITLGCYDIDPVTGDYTLVSTEEMFVDITLAGTGTIYRSRYSSQYGQPPFYTSSYNATGTFREATVTVLLDGEQVLMSGCYGQISNGRSSYSVSYNPHHQ